MHPNCGAPAWQAREGAAAGRDSALGLHLLGIRNCEGIFARNQRALIAGQCPCREISPYFTQHLECQCSPIIFPQPLFLAGVFTSPVGAFRTVDTVGFEEPSQPKGSPGRFVKAGGGSKAEAVTLVPVSPPEMYQFSIVETAPVGTAIGRVKAEDSDVGENTDMTYQVKDEEGVEMFKVTTDSNTQEAVITVQKVRSVD